MQMERFELTACACNIEMPRHAPPLQWHAPFQSVSSLIKRDMCNQAEIATHCGGCSMLQASALIFKTFALHVKQHAAWYVQHVHCFAATLFGECN